MAINFLSGLNAVQKIYAEKTGLLVPVGCGEDIPPTPPTPTEFTVSNVRVVEYDYNQWTVEADANMDATGYTVYVQGDNGAFDYYLMPDEEDPTKLVMDDTYENGIDPTMLSDGDNYTGWYREEGAVEEQTIEGTYTVVPMQRGPIEILSIGFWEEDEEWKCGGEADTNAVGYDIIVTGNSSEFNVKLIANEEDPSMLDMDENYENYIGDICDGGNWTAHTSYGTTVFEDQTGTYEDPCGHSTDCESEWEEREYSSYWDCECNENDHCVDCENDWESEGFESYEDCDCQVNGNCPPDCDNWEDMGYGSYWECECNENDHCVDCDNWEDEGFESYEDCDCEVNNHNCIDCENVWETEGYSSYEDCECQANGNCGGDRIELSDIVVNQQEDGYTIGGGINGETANEMYLVFDAEEIPIGVDYDHSSDPYWVFTVTYEGSSIEFEDGGICTLKVIDPEFGDVIQEDDYTYSYIPMDNEPL